MEYSNDLLSTEEVAQRLHVSQRRVQDLLAKGQLLGHKVGRGYRVWSHEVDRFARRERLRGRPRILATSNGELGIHTANVAGAVQEALSEDDMVQVFDEYLDWLEEHEDLLHRYDPTATPSQIVIANIELSTRRLPGPQRDQWLQVLEQMTVRQAQHALKHRAQHLADHLGQEYRLNAAIRCTNGTDWCVDLFDPNDNQRERPKTTIYQAAIHSLS